MKKNKKEKIAKQQSGVPKSKWRPWMTVLGVIGGVGVVTGATVLGVFLTGGFEEQVVLPESISFGYDENLFNDTYSQLEITDSENTGEFSLLISTPTSGVTENKVTLSFSGDDTTTAGGYISNSIIQVPKIVNIGQPFSVKLLKEQLVVGDETIDWIKGGISTLVAQSENEDLKSIHLKIAVDTPVYSTQTVVYDSNRQVIKIDEGSFPVLSGEAFYVESKFIPAKSQYMYADDSEVNNISEENRRKKHSFFEANLSASQSNALTSVYDSQYEIHFLASNKDYAEPISINAYTFRYADKEIEFVKNNQDKPALEFYKLAITELAGETTGAYKDEAKVSISPANIGEFSVANKNDISLVFGKSTKLYLNYNADDKNKPYLGASVVSNTGRELDNMLSNVAIRFTVNSDGGEIDAVDEKYISLTGSKKVTIDEKKYYLPNSDVANIVYGYWEITASDTLAGESTVEMEIVLLTNAEDKWSIYQDDGADVVVNKSLLLTERENYEIGWNDLSSINLTLEYDEGKFQPQAINLADLVDVPEGKDVVFFVNMKEGYDINKVLGATSYQGVQTYEATSSPTGTELELYILRDSTITLYTTGAFDVYFATVNSAKDYTDEKYIELWCNFSKSISCKEALFSSSVTGADIMFLGDKAAEIYYTYIGEKDEKGEDVTFTVNFSIDPNSLPSFRQALNNGEEFSVTLYNATDGDITGYFEINSIYLDETNCLYQITYKVKSNISVEGDGSTEDNKTALVKRVTLSYGTSSPIIWGGTDKFTFVKSLYVYNAIASSITSDSTVDAENISVEQKLTTGGEYSASIGYFIAGEEQDPLTGADAATQLAELLASTIEITDQHGNTHSLDGKWMFVTDKPNAIGINDDGQGFVFKNAEGTATLTIKSQDGNANIEKVYTLSLSTTGIQSIMYDDDAIGECDTYTEDVSSVKISMLGAKDNSATFADLIEFYTDAKTEAGGPSNKYTAAVTYSLSSTTLAKLSETQKIDLFGSTSDGGWLKAVDNNGATIYRDKDRGEWNGNTSNIVSISINNHFAQDVTLAINVTANGINTTLNLTIEANTYVSGENEYSIYAAYAYDSSTLSNEIKTGGEEASAEDTTATADYLLGRYTGTYYIVPEKNGKYYILSTSSEDEEDSVGKVSGGKINFNDFWDKENKTFEVRFTPDGENYYGLAYDITFTVLRNVVVETTSDDSFEIYDTASASTQLIGSFLSVKRVIGNSPLSSLAQYNLKNQILSVDASGNLKRTAGTLEFKAGDLYKEETIEVTIEGYSVGYVTIKVKLLDDVYSAVAEAITYAGADGSMGTASIQIVDGIKYVIIDGSLDATWIASLSISGGEATFLQKDSSKSLKVSLYTLLDGNELDPTKNGAIIGLNADYNTTADYILVQFENSTNGSNEFLRLPAIVTNVGPSPVKYQTIADDEEKIASQAGRADAITNYSERLLEVSLMTPDKLIEKGIYDTITAGESDYELLNKSLFNSGLAYTINVYSGTGAENSAITNKLIKGGISEGKISLYDLADNVTGDYYIALKFTLTANGYQQAFYYLLKVEPNVTTKTIYPYDGTYENLTKKEGKIDLNETFDNSTLANGKQRFEVYSLDDESYTSIASYSYIDQIIQVSINDVDVYTTEEAWSEFITLSLDNATHTITYKTDTTKPLKFVVRRSYVTASDASIEQIVNGSIDYVFAVNDNAVDYSIRFVQMGDNPSTDKIEESFTTVKPDEFGDTTYTLPFRNGATDVAGLNGNNYTGLKVLLVRNAIAGSAESGTVVYDELTVQQSDIEGDTGALVDYSYDNAKEAKGELKLNLNPYISQDTKITFVAFTTYGYTAKIVFDIKANAEVSLKTGVTTTLNGGADTAFGDIYSVKLNGEKTTTYTVTGISATESGKASELVSLGEDNNITLQDIAEDKTVDLTFTLDFGDERTFTFTQTFTLKANVQVKAEALVAESEIVAGEGVTVILKDLFDGYPTDSFKGDCSESDEPIDISGDVYTYVINTAFVSTREDKEVKFTFTLNSGDKVTAVYKYTIVPAVEMSVNYPDPDGDCTSLAMEYIEDKQDLTMNYDFFGDKAPFADTVRILIKSGSVAEGDSVVSYTTVKDSIDYTDEDFSIFLKTLSNASLYLKNEDGSYSEKSLSTNTEITGNTLKFERGLIATQSAVVVLTISYKGVSRDYTIYISDVLYSANGNYVTNNTSIADYETTSLSAETIYVDKTNISDLFADDRMAKVNISSTASIGEYYLVFADIQKMEVALWGSSVNLVLTGPTTGTIVNFSSANSTTKFTYKGETITQTGSFVWDESNNTVSISGTKDEVYTVNYYSNFYASYPLYIKSSDLGKTLTVDLGISMSGKTFYSAMLVSKLEDANVGLATDEDGKIATNRLMQVITTTTESDGSTTQSKTNLDEGYISDNKLTSSAITNLTLANRVQLYYGEKNNYYQVASDKYYIDSFNLSVSELGATMKQEVALKLSEGDEDNSTEFSYYYIPNIDITISSEKEASALGNYITLEASQEYTGDTSASRLFGLKHPTTGQYLSPADGDIIDLSFEVVNDVDAQTKDYYKKYITDGDSFKTTTSGGKQYLYYAQVVNASKRTYDFYFIPQGADNDGDFVLTKITYGVGDFTKTYYVVIKIVPDYQVRFGDVRAESEDGVVSNKDNPYIVKNLASSGNTYETFTLAGDGGHLSIKHKNGNNTSKELSVSGFTVKMREGDSTEIYNNQTNVASKLSTDLSSTDWASTEITKMVANNLKEYTLTNKTSLTFSNVKEVVFANQYYVINGEDDFGFKYEIYFTLQVTGPAPAVTADLYIKEGEAFDIALQYELLSFDSETNSISSETKIPSATTTSEYKLINLLGIEAYFADAATITAIESALNAGTLNLGGYADLPAINYVSIASNIYVVDEQGNIANVATDDKTKAGFATADGYEWGTFDSTTDTDGTETTTVAYNGVIESRPASANYTMPKLSGDAYGSGNVAQVTIMIPLQYQKTITLTDDATGNETETTDTEIYTLAVNAYVSRGTNIEIQDGNVVRDGVVFDVASHVEVTTTGVKPEFINDTLEVLVVKGQTGKFTMTLTRDGETLKTASVSLSNTGSGAYKTFYISLSEKFGQNVQDGDIVQIISDSNVEKFYYITGEASNESGKEFTIATISKDVIYLENADLLDDDNIADVTKYYIAKTTEQSAGADTPEDKYDDKYEGASYYYRVSRTYQVTAYYYTLEKAYDGSVANVLSTSSSSFELSSWGDAFNCLILDQYGSSSSGTASSDYLRFGLVSDGKSAVGKVKEIKQSGEIVLNEQLKANEYIKIKIELVVSGTDRDGTETEYNADYIYFDLGEDGEFNIAP